MKNFLRRPFQYPGRLLHIGYPSEHIADLAKAGNDITVLGGISSAMADKNVSRFLIGTVEDVDGTDGLFDYIWWYHGPENIDECQFIPIMEKLKSKTRYHVAVFSRADIDEPCLWKPDWVDFVRVGMKTILTSREIVGYIGE